MVEGFASLGNETRKTAGVSAKAQQTPKKQLPLRDHERNPLELETRTTGLVG